MAAERDETGPSGLTGSGRDFGGMETSGASAPMGDAPGNAEVHAGIAFAAETPSSTGRLRGVAETVTERAGELGQRARTVAGEVGHRAGELASQARDRAEVFGERAHTALENRGVLAKMRDNPLPALGIAFAAGFLLAGGGRRGAKQGGKTQRARHELRSALIAGLSAGVAHGARDFLRSLGAEDSVLNDVASNLPGLSEPAGAKSGSRAGRGTSGGRTSRQRPPSHQEQL
jgi:hypothetical protein